MLLVLIKSILYMFIFYIFLRISNFFIKFIYQLFYKQNKEQTNDNTTPTLKMMQCDICKTYITKSEAHIVNGKILCDDHKNNDVN